MAEEAGKSLKLLWIGIGATTALVAIVGIKALRGPSCDDFETTFIS